MTLEESLSPAFGVMMTPPFPCDEQKCFQGDLRPEIGPGQLHPLSKGLPG